MAAWQVRFHVLPRSAFAKAAPLTSATLDETAWWANATLRADYGTRIAAAAAPLVAIDPDVEVWGPAEDNRVEVRSAGGRVRSVRAWVDVRRLDSRFGAAFIDFVRKVDAVLVRGDGLVVEPTIAAYAGSLRTSNAWRYASDPAAHLAAQAVDDEDDDDD
jgi:hypothetical protein